MIDTAIANAQHQKPPLLLFLGFPREMKHVEGHATMPSITIVAISSPAYPIEKPLTS
jgi:hypothetical protein